MTLSITGEMGEREGSEKAHPTHQHVLIGAPGLLADVGVDLVAPALRALLTTAVGNLTGHLCPSVAVLPLL
jgi:hypothetical protein